MKSRLKLALLSAMTALTLPMAAHAQWWNQHPGYLHALSDLRMAYALIQHRGPSDPIKAIEEDNAANEISAAYNELANASVADGKNLNDLPPAGFDYGDHYGRLHMAEEYLRSAGHDINSEEENPAARGLRDRAIHHIGRASRAIVAAAHEGRR